MLSPRFEPPPRDSPRPDDVGRDGRIAAVVVAVVASFALRMALGNPGPVEFVPVLLAAAWFGLRPARLTAGAASGLLAVALVIVGGIGVVTLIVTAAVLFATAEMTGRLLERIELQAGELRTLRPLQNALAPSHPPELPLLELGVRYLPATPGAAGDFYLITEGHNNSTIIAIGDVMGKGVKAAERGTFMRATLAAISTSTDDPAYLLRAANAQLVSEYGLSADFITMLCVIVCADGSMSWASAGHPPPLSLADGSPIGPLYPCFPLGIAPELTGLRTVSSELPDAGMLLYTDGLTDAKPRSFEAFGRDRLGLVLRELGDASPQEAVDRLVAAAQLFARRPLSDDVCLVAVRSKVRRRLASVPETPSSDERETPPGVAAAAAAEERRAAPGRRLVATALVGVACGAAAVGAAMLAVGSSETRAPERRTTASSRVDAPAAAGQRRSAGRPAKGRDPARVVRLARLKGAPPGARGSGRLADGRLELSVTGLGQPRVRRGTVWLTNASGGAVPVARFAGATASVQVPVPKSSAPYRGVEVSIRPAPTVPPLIERPVLRAPLPKVPAPPAP